MKQVFNNMNPMVRTTALVIFYWAAWYVITPLIVSPALFAFPPALQILGTGLIGCLTAWLLARWLPAVERAVPTPRHPKNLFVQAGIGLAAGSVLLFAAVAIILWPGGFEWTSLGAVCGDDPALMYIGIIPLAMMEEIAFRGKAFRLLEQAVGIWVAQLLMATAFALFHLSANYTLTEAFTGPFLWAFIFGVAALWTRNIAVSTGIHVAANAWQALLGMKGVNRGAIGSFSATPYQLIPGLSGLRLSQIGVAVMLSAAAVALTTWYARRERDT